MFRITAILILLALVAVGCGRSDRFLVEGTLADMVDKEVRLVWNDGSGAVCAIGTHTDGRGNFKLEGASETYTLVSLTDADGWPLASFPVVNGEKLQVEGSRKALTVTGTEAAGLLTELRKRLKTLKGDSRVREVAAFVRANSGSVAATVALIEEFDGRGNPKMADSLFNLIDASARPLSLVESYAEGLGIADVNATHITGFSILTSKGEVERLTLSDEPFTLVMAVGLDGVGPEGMRLIETTRREHPRLRVVELMLEGDSARWQASVKRHSGLDSLPGVVRGWVPGGVGAPGLKGLGISRMPMALLADSSARIVWKKYSY